MKTLRQIITTESVPEPTAISLLLIAAGGLLLLRTIRRCHGRDMKLSILTVAAALIALAATSASAAVIQSTFDTDLDGWIQDTAPGPGATISWTSNGGNPGGYLRRGLGDAAGVSVLVAPSKFLGNRSAFNGGTFQWDGELISGNVSNTYNDGGNLAQPDYGTIRIDGGGLFATTDIVPGAPPSSWTTFSTPLTASAFGVSEADWSTILGNVTSLKFSIEAISGPEQQGVDNFRIVPEPSSTLIGAIGLLGILLRRFRSDRNA